MKNFDRSPDHIYFHYFGTKIGVTFKVDAQKYPENADVEGKSNQFYMDKDGLGVCLGLIKTGDQPSTRTETQFCKR